MNSVESACSVYVSSPRYRHSRELVFKFSMPVAERCRRVVELARKYNLLVVCDDVYNLLYFGDKPPHRLFQFDKK